MNISGEYTFDAPKQIVWDALQEPAVLAAVLPGCEKLEEVGENQYEGILKMKIGPMNGKFKGSIKIEDIVAPDSYKMLVDGKGTPGFIKANGSLNLTDQGEKTLLNYDGSAQVGGRIASVGQRLIDSSAKAIINQSLQGLNAAMKVRAEAAAVTTATESAIAEVEAVVEEAGMKVEEKVDEVKAEVETEVNEVKAEIAEGVDSVKEVVQEKVNETVEKVAAAAPPPPISEVQAPSQMEFATSVAKDVAKDLIPKPVLIGGALVIAIAILYLLFG